jgi:hypothetical protein
MCSFQNILQKECDAGVGSVFIVTVTRNNLADKTGAINMENVKYLAMRTVTVCGRKTCGVKVTGNLKISPFIRYMNSLHAVYKLKA